MKASWIPNGTLSANGKTLEYLCVGPPPSDAPTLVLLHEGLGSTRLWRDVPSALFEACGFGVFAYSRAGYGQSDPVSLPRPLDYMTREALDVLPEVLDVMGVQHAVLMGHSDGATIAAIHAGSVVDKRVLGIVLIAPHFFAEAIGLKAIAQARDAFNNGDLRTRLARYHSDADNAFRGWNDSWLHPDFKNWNVNNVLDNICVPVLAIQGRDDPYGTLAQIDAVNNGVKHASVDTLILDDCKHAPHLEHKETVITAISEFCKPFNCNSTNYTNKLVDSTNIQLPSHAYIPGQNKRHPENHFDAIRQTAKNGLSADQLAQCEAYRTGLALLDAGFYWEAHEVLEPVWMALPENALERQFVQGLIQYANGRLKLRMGRPKAALRLVGIARKLMPENDDRSVLIMMLDVNQVLCLIDALAYDANLAI